MASVLDADAEEDKASVVEEKLEREVKLSITEEL